MERNDVVDLYDGDYASSYDDRFLTSEWARVGAEFEEGILRGLLTGDEPRWLDVACGTGWFLSRFPGTPRAGLDISPSMLERARASNPDAEFLREADFREDVSEWHGAWSVVSCMWTAYNYVRSMSELDDLVANLVRWTRPGGAVFIPVMDLEDLRYVQVPYEASPDVFGGHIALTGATWTWDEAGNGKHHEHLIAPHVEHFIRLLEPHFERIRVARYPLAGGGGIARKAVVATGRRVGAETGRCTVERDPLPAGAHDAEAWQRAETADLAAIQTAVGDLRREVADLRQQVSSVQGQTRTVAGNLLRSDGSGTEPYDIVGAVHEQVAGIRRELAELSQRLTGDAGSTGRSGSGRRIARRAVSKARRLISR